MIENMAPGAIERMGLSYEARSVMNPGIIYAQVKGFGEGSPYEHKLAFDMIAQACGGTMSASPASPNGPPTRPGISIGDTARNADGDHGSWARCNKRPRDGRGPSPAGRPCRTAMLHLHAASTLPTQGLTGKPAERGGSRGARREQRADGAVSVCAGRAERLRSTSMTSRARTRTHWDRLLKADRSARPDWRQALPDARRIASSGKSPEVDEIISVWTPQAPPSSWP